MANLMRDTEDFWMSTSVSRTGIVSRPRTWRLSERTGRYDGKEQSRMQIVVRYMIYSA
jgi:hypothetical protein